MYVETWHGNSNLLNRHVVGQVLGDVGHGLGVVLGDDGRMVVVPL